MTFENISKAIVCLEDYLKSIGSMPDELSIASIEVYKKESVIFIEIEFFNMEDILDSIEIRTNENLSEIEIWDYVDEDEMIEKCVFKKSNP